MSQYTLKITRKGKRYLVVYGFDNIYARYFITVYDLSIKKGDKTILSKSTNMKNGIKTENTKMIELFREWGVYNKDHLVAVSLDIEF